MQGGINLKNIITGDNKDDNWNECHDCGKPLYLGKHSDFVGPEYSPTLVDEKLKCKDCTSQKGGYRRNYFLR